MVETESTSKEKRENRFEEMQKELAERGREVWLAGLGALATVEEEGSRLFTRLVERGRAYEQDSAKQINQLADRASEQQKKAMERAEETTAAAQSAFASSVDKALERFGVPTRSEVSDLSEKVNHLSRQIDELSNRLEETGRGRTGARETGEGAREKGK